MLFFNARLPCIAQIALLILLAALTEGLRLQPHQGHSSVRVRVIQNGSVSDEGARAIMLEEDVNGSDDALAQLNLDEDIGDDYVDDFGVSTSLMEASAHRRRSTSVRRRQSTSVRRRQSTNVRRRQNTNVRRRQSTSVRRRQSTNAPTSCCGDVRNSLSGIKRQMGKVALAFGNQDGICCIIESGYKRDHVLPVYSASKWVTGYVILRLIDDGKLTLDTRVCKVLDWWSCGTSSRDNRGKVTVRHLLAQTDGMSTFERGLGQCRAKSGTECAKHAYRRLRARPGTSFKYTETSFYVMGEIAKQMTGARNYNAVFRSVIADRLGMSRQSQFGTSRTYSINGGHDPGGSLLTSLVDYSKFLHAVFKKSLVSKKLVQEAEKVQTPRKPGMEDYGLAEWVECSDRKCKKTLRVHSQGLAGTFPWVQRSGVPHWGLLVQYDMNQGNVRRKLGMLRRQLMPKIAAAIKAKSR